MKKPNKTTAAYKIYKRYSDIYMDEGYSIVQKGRAKKILKNLFAKNARKAREEQRRCL